MHSGNAHTSVFHDAQLAVAELVRAAPHDGHKEITIAYQDSGSPAYCRLYNTAVAALVGLAFMLSPEGRAANNEPLLKPISDGACLVQLPANIQEKPLCARIQKMQGDLAKRLQSANSVRKQALNKHVDYVLLEYENKTQQDADFKLISTLAMAHGHADACSKLTDLSKPALRLSKALVSALQQTEYLAAVSPD